MLLPDYVNDHTVIQCLISQSRYDEQNGAIYTKSVMFKNERDDEEKPLAYDAHKMPTGVMQARCVNLKQCGGSFVLKDQPVLKHCRLVNG